MSTKVGLAWILAASLASCAGGAPVGKAEIIQVVPGLNNPESVAFSLDGKWLYVSN